MAARLDIVIVCPWPASGLSPNARLHWAKVYKLKKPYRATCAAIAAQALRGLPAYPAEGKVPVAITFHPPDRRGRDDDNMIGAFKAGRDGIAEAIGVNDKRFETTYRIAEPRKGGMVVVELASPASLGGAQREDGQEAMQVAPDWLTRS